MRTGCMGGGGWEGGRGQGQVPRIDPLDFKPGCCLHRVHTSVTVIANIRSLVGGGGLGSRGVGVRAGGMGGGGSKDTYLE